MLVPWLEPYTIWPTTLLWHYATCAFTPIDQNSFKSKVSYPISFTSFVLRSIPSSGIQRSSSPRLQCQHLHELNYVNGKKLILWTLNFSLPPSRLCVNGMGATFTHTPGTPTRPIPDRRHTEHKLHYLEWPRADRYAGRYGVCFESGWRCDGGVSWLERIWLS